MPAWPGISIIVPTYNAGAHLQRLLDSIRGQDYPQAQLELIIVDDDSEDNTCALAREYGAKIFRNGQRHIERGKAIGIAQAQQAFILFLDADNYLVSPQWLQSAVAPLLANERLVGAESIRFHYVASDPPANRYCSLYGINDPLAFYLNRRDRLTAIETAWQLLGRVEDKGDYYIGEFSLPRVPTLGSQGFLIRRSLLQYVQHDPYFFHMEANLELIQKGYNQYVLLKSSIGHDHVSTAAAFLKKCRRNIELFYRYQHLRTYRWETSGPGLFFTVLSMVTLLRPLYAAGRGFLKKPDPAWFLHPWFCLAVPIIYGYVTLAWKIKKVLGIK